MTSPSFRATARVISAHLRDVSKTAAREILHLHLKVEVLSTVPADLLERLPTRSLHFSVKNPDGPQQEIQAGDSVIFDVKAQRLEDPDWYAVTGVCRVMPPTSTSGIR